MSFSANRHSANNLAAQLSATEDGLHTNANFEAAFHDDSVGGFEVSRGGSVSGIAFSALGNFDLGMTEYDAVEQACDIGTTLLSDDPIQEAVDSNAGVAWPTPYSAPTFFSGDGSEIRSQDLGNDNSLALMEFCTDRMRDSLSGHSKPSMASLEGLGALAQTSPTNPRVRDYRKIVAATLLPGTPIAGKTARALLLKSRRLAELADKRAQVVADSRRGFQEALNEAHLHDQRALQTARQMLDANGNFKPGTTTLDVERLKKMRERAFNAGRRAIRYQKVNVLATALARNAIAQTDLLQKTAAAVAAGNVGVVAALGAMYDEIGQQSLQIKALRKQQVQKWQSDGLSGLGTADCYESALNGTELEWGGWLKKAFRKVKKASRPFLKGVKESAKIAMAPVQATVKAGVQVGHGNFKGAFKSIGKSVVDSAKSVKNIAASALLDVPCLLASSKIGRTALRAAAQAVGTYYGGQVGGAVGSEAGRQAGDTNKTMCGAIKHVGLTDGSFHPGKVKGAFKHASNELWRNNLSPKAMLKSVENVALSYVMGAASSYASGAVSGATSGIGGSDIASFGKDTVGKLGLNKLAQQSASELQKKGIAYAQKKAIEAGTQQLRKAVGPQAASVIQQGAQIYASGGKVDAKELTQAAVALAKKQGGKIAQKQVLQIAQQMAAKKGLNLQAELQNADRILAQARRAQAVVRARVTAPAAARVSMATSADAGSDEKWLQTSSIFG